MSFQDDVYRAAIVLRVFCHGEVDRMDLTKHFLVEADPDLRLEEGISFQPKAEPTLAAPAMRLTNG
jgi:hypothetical protein